MLLARSESRRRLAALGPRRRFAMAAFAGQAAFAAIAFGGSVASARILGPSGKGTLTAWTVAATLVALVLSGAYPNGFARAYLQGRRSTVIPTAALRWVSAGAGWWVAWRWGGIRWAWWWFILTRGPSRCLATAWLWLFRPAKARWGNTCRGLAARPCSASAPASSTSRGAATGM